MLNYEQTLVSNSLSGLSFDMSMGTKNNPQIAFSSLKKKKGWASLALDIRKLSINSFFQLCISTATNCPSRNLHTLCRIRKGWTYGHLHKGDPCYICTVMCTLHLSTLLFPHLLCTSCRAGTGRCVRDTRGGCCPHRVSLDLCYPIRQLLVPWGHWALEMCCVKHASDFKDWAQKRM